MPADYRGLIRSPGPSLAALGVLLSIGTIILFVADLHSRYSERIASAKTDAQSFAKILAEHTVLTFDEVDKVLLEAETLRRDGLAGRYAAPGSLTAALRQLQRSSPVVVALGWTDASGDLLAHSYQREPPRRNIADMAHFKVQRDDAGVGLFIAPPFRSAAGDRWLTAVSRRVNNPDGSFGGVISAPIDQTYFNKIYRSIDIGRGGAVILLHRGGLILAREPNLPAALGKSFAGTILFTELLPAADAGAFEMTSTVNGVERIAGYKEVTGLPLIVIVTYARNDVLQSWYRYAYAAGLVVAAIVIIILLGTFVLVRQTNALAANTRTLAVTNTRFDAALSNMPHGLSMFDANERLLVCNDRYCEIYGLDRAQVRPGTPLGDILRLFGQRSEEVDFRVDTFWQEAKSRAPRVLKLASGRIILIVRTPMKGGGWVATHEDITERTVNERRVAFLAQHDLLTGLANRALFAERLEQAASGLRQKGRAFTVFMLDLDRFKQVNDTLGHPAGDKLLIEVAQRLKSSLREGDVLARLGGDEFAIIQEHEKNQEEGAIALALRIIALIEEPFDLDGSRVEIGTSIGIAAAPKHGFDPDVLMQRADIALYAAKSAGRNDFRIFEPQLTEAADLQRSMEGELREALALDQLELFYQPIVTVDTQRVSSVEAFVRWHHAVRGTLGPNQFLRLAETTGLILPLQEWILRQACLDAATWPDGIKLSLNVPSVQLRKGNLFDVVLCALVDSGLPPERLELEIAGVAALEEDLTANLQTIKQLKNIGVSIVLDNCAAGYSAASYLSSFPFDKIKIDKSFTQGVGNRRDCDAAVASLMALARGLNIPTVAKGVETRQQLDAMRCAGADFAQGYLFGEPASLAELDLDRSPAKNVA
jgi:diguanylate cyclase (GGDEF)-like protein